MEVHAVKSWVDIKKGSVIEVTEDVQNIVSEIRQISPRLHVFFNDQSGGFDVVESCLDGTDRLVCSVPQLDKRLPERLRAADHWYGQEAPTFVLPDEEDFAAKIDRDNEVLEEALREEAREKIRYAGEALAWSLDICHDRSSVGGSILVPKDVKNGPA